MHKSGVVGSPFRSRANMDVAGLEVENYYLSAPRMTYKTTWCDQSSRGTFDPWQQKESLTTFAHKTLRFSVLQQIVTRTWFSDVGDLLGSFQSKALKSDLLVLDCQDPVAVPSDNVLETHSDQKELFVRDVLRRPGRVVCCVRVSRVQGRTDREQTVGGV